MDLSNLTVTHVSVDYDPVTLKRWKNRDPQIVPESYLQRKGPGISNGYGFGEWWAETYYIRNGYKVIGDFNLVAKKSKFQLNNSIIKDLLYLGNEKLRNSLKRLEN